jgi:hypothetical protein
MGRKKKIKPPEKILVGKASLKLECCKCKTIYNIEVNKAEVYTKEVKDSWECLVCQSKR